MSKKKLTCPDCRGEGKVRCFQCSSGWTMSPYGLQVCAVCGGSQKYICSTCKGSGSINGDDQAGQLCSTCHGTGKTEVCWKCRGSGYLYGDFSLRQICDACLGRRYELCRSCGGRGIAP